MPYYARTVSGSQGYKYFYWNGAQWVFFDGDDTLMGGCDGGERELTQCEWIMDHDGTQSFAQMPGAKASANCIAPTLAPTDSPTAPPFAECVQEAVEIAGTATANGTESALYGTYALHECVNGVARYKHAQRELYLHFVGDGWALSASVDAASELAFCQATQLADCVAGSWFVEPVGVPSGSASALLRLSSGSVFTVALNHRGHVRWRRRS